jgi:hypothetical protein
MRDDAWLFLKLDEVWDGHFSDVPQLNDVKIVWGRKARNRLGSIKQGERRLGSPVETIITINSLFKDEEIPEFIVTATIAHELAHYAHGFHSPLAKKYDHPHAGGAVNKELAKRGLEESMREQKKWLKTYWKDYVNEHLPRKQGVKRKVRRKLIIKWI